MIPKPIQQIVLADLQAMVGVVRESKTIEFKSEMPGRRDSDTVPFLAGISSLANTVGGDFILGVVANDGLAESVPGMELSSLDAEQQRLEQLLASGVEPRLPRVDIHPVECGEGRFVLVIRVPHSWIGPHRVKQNERFYGRNSSGRYPLDVGELRLAFGLTESIAERIRSFRAERLNQILSGDTALPLLEGAKVVLHLVPLPSFADRNLIDVAATLTSRPGVPLPLDGISHANQQTVNIDGYVNYKSAPAGKARSYGQLFRSGAIEGVSVLDCDERGAPYLDGTEFGNMIVLGIQQYLNIQESYVLGLPAFALVSLCNVDGCYLRYHPAGAGYNVVGPLRSNVVALPEIVFDINNPDVPALMRPIFNIVWNAFGLLQSDMYTSAGEWKGLRSYSLGG